MPDHRRWACDLVRWFFKAFARPSALVRLRSGHTLVRRSPGDTSPVALRQSVVHAQVRVHLIVSLDLCMDVQ